MSWPTTPTCIPKEYRYDGANALAKALGHGSKLGPGPLAARTFRDCYVWYAGEDSVKKTLSFQVAHKHASDALRRLAIKNPDNQAQIAKHCVGMLSNQSTGAQQRAAQVLPSSPHGGCT